jgi:hypothetical protein
MTPQLPGGGLVELSRAAYQGTPLAVEWQARLRNQRQHYAHPRTASPSLIPQIGYGLLELLCYFLSGVLAGLLAGYASHLDRINNQNPNPSG